MHPSETQSSLSQGQVADKSSETRAILRQILEGLEARIREQFFPSLVQQLAAALGVD